MSTEEYNIIMTELGEIKKMLNERLPPTAPVYKKQKRCDTCLYPQFWSLELGPPKCNVCGLSVETNG